MTGLLPFAVFGVFSLNLPVQLGMGIPEYDGSAPERFLPVIVQGCMRFLTVLLFWRLFTWVFPSPGGAFLEYFCAFPLLFAAGKGLERLFPRFRKENSGKPPLFSVNDAFLGQSFVALSITLRFAAHFSQAVALSLAFSLGNLLSLFIIWAVQRRASLERVPQVLRGAPLLLISAGLLSLVFSSLEGLFYRVLFP